jgi:outer membrane protein assembly factor BamE (lipoprotein component of BamABCDE complex)
MKKLYPLSFTFLITSILLGCASYSEMPWVITQKRESLLELEVGMPKKDVLDIMGKPYSRESSTGLNGESVDYLFYLTQYRDGGSIPESDKTPVCIFNGILTGWGWDFYNRAKRDQSNRRARSEVAITKDFKIIHFHYDDATKKGVISVRTYGRGIKCREWLVKNIGAICSSKNVTLQAGSESKKGGRYRILSEKIENDILTVQFESAW